MDVLKNTEVRDGKVDSKKTNEIIGSIPKSDDVPFKVKDLLLGVSVEYAPKDGYEWYVLRATYGREIKALETIRSMANLKRFSSLSSSSSYSSIQTKRKLTGLSTKCQN